MDTSGMNTTEVPTTELSQYELEARLIYAVLVAGKTYKFATDKFDGLRAYWDLTIVASGRQVSTPFQGLRYYNFAEILRSVRTGRYATLEKTFTELTTRDINLRTCAPEELEEIPGIGPKTARFFIMWTRPGARYAALDTHVLRWLRGKGIDAPRTTPSGRKYRELENIFLWYADSMGLSPRELDAQIWSEATGIN
jgi:DNA uptake protein ComE-like DNA-binding protein